MPKKFSRNAYKWRTFVSGGYRTSLDSGQRAGGINRKLGSEKYMVIVVARKRSDN
ncbi:MAG: hypothetical protein AAB333_01475 [Pseudomonadota bacterium]